MNPTRKRMSAEQIEKNRQLIQEIKVKSEKARLKKVEEKSKFFKGIGGKVLWTFSVFMIVFCVVFIVDGNLKKKYTNFEIKSTAKDYVPLYVGGDYVKSTFYWTYFDDQSKFGILMHHNDFEIVNKKGSVDIGRSPIFKIPTEFYSKNKLGMNSHVLLEKSYSYQIVLPLFIIALSLLWLFAKPQKSLQWIMYGYLHMVITTLLFLFLVLKALNYINDIGLYDINLNGLNI